MFFSRQILQKSLKIKLLTILMLYISVWSDLRHSSLDGSFSLYLVYQVDKRVITLPLKEFLPSEFWPIGRFLKHWHLNIFQHKYLPLYWALTDLSCSMISQFYLFRIEKWLLLNLEFSIFLTSSYFV